MAFDQAAPDRPEQELVQGGGQEPPALPMEGVVRPMKMVTAGPPWPTLELMSYDPLIRCEALTDAHAALDRLKVDL